MRSQPDPGRASSILFVSDSVPHYRIGLLVALQANGFRVDIFAGEAGKRSDVPSADLGGFTWFRARAFRGPGPVVFVPGVAKTLLRTRPTTVLFFANPWWPHVWLGSIFARLLGVRVLHWTHGWYSDDGPLKGHFRALCYRLSHHLLVFGKGSRDIGCRKFGYKPARVSVIGNSVPNGPIVDPVAKPPSVAGITRVIVVARLIPQRRIDLLVHAVAALADMGRRDIHAIIVGEGVCRVEAEDLARELGVDDLISFVGPVYSPQELREYYGAASICAIPGKAGLSVIDAMRHGCPVIVSDDVAEHAPEHEAVIHGVNGARFRSGDATSLAKAIASLTDPRHWQDLSNAALDTVRREYSPESQLRCVLRVLTNTP